MGFRSPGAADGITTVSKLLDLVLKVPAEINPNAVTVRMAGTQDAPLWCLADLCKALDLSNPSHVAGRLDEDERGIILSDTPSGQQQMVFVTEPGLYKVILRSDKPAAKAFTRWVCHEVLPSLRKFGCYPAPADDGPDGRRQVRDLVREELAALLAGVPRPVERPPQLIDPREFVLRAWPEASDRVLKLVVRRMDTLYRQELGRPAPQAFAHDAAPLMCEPEGVALLMRSLTYYWRKENPPRDPELFDPSVN